jgi:3-phenylpropionate/cinnamic acid dioxygenase small subunit
VSFSETTGPQHEVVVHSKVEQFLYHEARLLDDWKLDDWLALFTSEGLYWVPINDSAPIERQGAIIYDPTLRREERVYHLLHTDFPAQTPRSRLVHIVSNVQVEGDGEQLKVSSNQIVYEMRTGDFGQKGIGDITPIVSRVDYVLRQTGGGFRIAEKKILLINRDTWQGNLTFIL